MLRTFRAHWPEYLCESLGLGLFMLSAALFATLLEHPDSPVRQALADQLTRRALMGTAMGLTGIANVYSPWGRRSGCHLNPAVTLTFLYLGKIARADAVLYIVFQALGGVGGIALAAALLGGYLTDPSVRWVVTVPGTSGVYVAFAAETLISFGLMLLVLTCSNHRRTSHLTGIFVGALVGVYITFEAPLSGMSMNPARSFASALPARLWTGWWIYCTAPPAGMFAAAALYRAVAGIRAVACAKLHHDTTSRCFFRCSFAQLALRSPDPGSVPHPQQSHG